MTRAPSTACESPSSCSSLPGGSAPRTAALRSSQPGAGSARLPPASCSRRVPAYLSLMCPVAQALRSDNGPEFVSEVLDAWREGRGCSPSRAIPGRKAA